MLYRWLGLFFLSGTLSYAAQPIPKAQELFVPYWSSEPGWDTQLQLRNKQVSTSLTVTPVLRTASGREISLTPLTIRANESVSVWVSEGLLEHAPDLLSQSGSYGSVVFRFVSPAAVGLHATAIVMLNGQPITVRNGNRAAWRRAAKSGGSEAFSLEGVWWHPRAGLSDVLVVSNSSGNKVNGSLSLFAATGRRWSQPMALGPRQTERIAVNDYVKRVDIPR